MIQKPFLAPQTATVPAQCPVGANDVDVRVPASPGGEREQPRVVVRPARHRQREEARGSERVYGRIGSYFEYDLTADKPLRVQYRLWLQEGEMTVEQCEALSRAFTDKIQVAAK